VGYFIESFTEVQEDAVHLASLLCVCARSWVVPNSCVSYIIGDVVQISLSLM